MLAELKPYLEYRDEPWIGAVPAHWQLRRAKYVLREIDQRWTERTGQLLSVSQYTGVTKRRLREGSDEPATRSESLEGYKVVAADDLAVNIMLAWNGSLGVAPFAGVVSPAYCVYRFREGNPWYFHNLLRSPDYRAEIKRRSRGVVESRLRLYSDDLFRVPLLVPPPAEQAGIVRFLGAVDRKVNRFIRAKRRLIEVLTEQKQAIITHAVTKGLSPHAPLKPSGIDWLGDVPEHWTVSRAGSVAEFISTKAHEQFVEDDGEHICVTARFVSTDGRSFRRCTQNFSPAQRGDVLMVMSDLPRGRALARAYFVNDDKSYAVNQRVCILRPRRVNPRYLAFAANRHAELLAHDDGFNQTHLPNAAFKIMRLALPPLAEQEQIVASLVRRTGAIDATLERTEREISLIREYRTRLVADVVTGKVDVRAAAAALPDEPPLDGAAAAGGRVGDDEPAAADEAEGDADDADAERADTSHEEVEA